MSFIPDLENLNDLEFFHDEPDPNSDVFGYHYFCENLVSIVSKQKDTPFSILIHGEWGSGKTSVLVKSELNLKELEAQDSNFNVILFEVWKYERVDPVASLLEEIKDKIKGKNSGRFGEIAKNVGLLLFDMAVRAHTNLSLAEAKEYFEDSLSGIKNLRNEMETLMENKKLVILFDDLDRCSFETMLELIEAIRLFLSVRGVICVVAADNERLRAAWRNKYPTTSENETNEYFDKIFQLRLALPNKEQIAVSDYITKLKPSYIGDTEKNLINVSTSNPRKIKQILNVIFFGLKYSKLNRKLTKDNLHSYYPIIVTWAIISILYPRFGNLLRTHHDSLNEILDFIFVIKSYQEIDNKHAKIDMDNEKMAESVFRILNEFWEYEPTHYLRLKSDVISIWSFRILKKIAEDFELFYFFWQILDYVGSGIKFSAGDYMKPIEFVSNGIVNDVTKQLGLL